jgi:hypothetical protein
MDSEPLAPGAWVICEVGSNAGTQRFTARVQGSYTAENSRVYQIEAELPQGRPVIRVHASAIVSVF